MNDKQTLELFVTIAEEGHLNTRVMFELVKAQSLKIESLRQLISILVTLTGTPESNEARGGLLKKLEAIVDESGSNPKEAQVFDGFKAAQERSEQMLQALHILAGKLGSAQAPLTLPARRRRKFRQLREGDSVECTDPAPYVIEGSSGEHPAVELGKRYTVDEFKLIGSVGAISLMECTPGCFYRAWSFRKIARS